MQPLVVNTLHNVYVVEKLIQLTVRSNVEFILTRTEPKILLRTNLSNTLKAATAVLNRANSDLPNRFSQTLVRHRDPLKVLLKKSILLNFNLKVLYSFPSKSP